MSAPLRALSAPVTSRRVSAGITPVPGSTSRLPVWWGRADWLEVEVRGALDEHPGACREHHVSPDAVLAVARAMASFADAVTGRDCRPTNERMVEAARVSLSTVQRARRVLKALRLVVEVTAGRSVMTLAERLAAHERGSSHRAIAAEFVLCSRRDRRPRLVDNQAPDLQVVDGDTPPVGKVVRTHPQQSRGHLRTRTETMSTASRRAHTETIHRRARDGVDPAARRLAEALRWRVGWLRDVPARRMAPTLTRFARAGWSLRDVELAIRDVLAARGKRVPARLDRPAAYLAWLLRDVDPADRPSVLEDAYAAAMAAAAAARRSAAAETRAAQRRWTAALATSCAHGVPAGDVPDPAGGHLACLDCRRASQQASPG